MIDLKTLSKDTLILLLHAGHSAAGQAIGDGEATSERITEDGIARVLEDGTTIRVTE